MQRTGLDALKTPAIGQGDPLWATWSDDALLDLPMCNLRLDIKGGFLEQPIAELGRELEERRLLFRPHFWLSNEWFTPDGVPGIAVPFYLAHPRLEPAACCCIRGTRLPSACARSTPTGSPWRNPSPRSK